MDTYGDILNNIDVEITGPEGTYNGTITDDSLIFVNLPYGEYNGTAWMEGEDPDTASTVLGEFDHDIIFVFDLTGIQNGISLSENALAVSPNPFSDFTNISVRLNDPSIVSLKIYSQQGQLMKTLIDGQMDAGSHQITWSGESVSGKKVAAGMYTVVLQTSSGSKSKLFIKMN